MVMPRRASTERTRVGAVAAGALAPGMIVAAELVADDMVIMIAHRDGICNGFCLREHRWGFGV